MTGSAIPDQDIDAVVAANESPLLRYVSGMIGDSHAAQDVVQSTFIKLLRKWRPGTRPSASLKAWLYRVAHNEAVDHLRREQQRVRLHLVHAQERTDVAAAPRDDAADRIESVLAAVRELDPAEQQVVLLRLQEGLSYQQIARVTGRTEGNVGCILHNAVKKLGRLLKASTTDRTGGGAS